MEVTGADPGDPIGEGTGGPITDTDGMALILRTPDAGGTAGAGYVPRGESSFTDTSAQSLRRARGFLPAALLSSCTRVKPHPFSDPERMPEIDT